MATLSALVRGLDAELLRLGYKDATMAWYRRCWRRMQEHFAARGVEEFSLDAAMAWVDDACGFFGKEQAGTLKPNDIYLFRVAQMLGEYAAHGAVLRRYNRLVSKLDGAGAEAVARFQAHLRSAGRSASTVRTYGRWPGSSSRSPAPAAGWPAVTPPRSGRSSPRLRATSSRLSSRNCARCGRSCGSPAAAGWSTARAWRWSRRHAPAGRPGSRRCGIRAR